MDPRVAELMPVIEMFGFSEPDIAAVRERFHATAATFPRPDDVEILPTTLAGRQALRFLPLGGSNGSRILHLHGGAFVIAALDVQLAMPAQLCVSTGCEVLSLDYRVAPEHPCPAATEDAADAYVELLADGPVRSIAGESAGGSLAVLAALELRDRGVDLPSSLLCFSPWFDPSGTSPRFVDDDVEDPVLPRSLLTMSAAAWRGDLTIDDPRVTPLSARLGGLPPTLIHVGGDELLVDDALSAAGRLADAGVEVELRVFPSMPHVFTAYPTLVPESSRSLAAAAAFLAAH